MVIRKSKTGKTKNLGPNENRPGSSPSARQARGKGSGRVTASVETRVGPRRWKDFRQGVWRARNDGGRGMGQRGGTRAICRAMGVGRLKWRRVMRSGIWVRGRTIGWLQGSSLPIWPVPRHPSSVRGTCEPATRVSVAFPTVRTETDTGAWVGSLVRTRVQ